MAKHTQATIERIFALAAGGINAAEIGRTLNLSPSTVKHHLHRRQSSEAHAQAPVASRDMQIAALEQQIRELTAKLTPERAPVECAYKDETDWDALWLAAEEDNAKRISKSALQGRFTATLPSEPVGISFISDQHISTGNLVDLKRMRQDAELIAQTPGLFAILGGDLCDNHIKHRSAVLASRDQPHDQWMLAESYLRIFAHKILVMISGNHDKWTDQIAGVDMLAGLARAGKIHYAPDEARIRIMAGDQHYDAAVRHQYRFNSSLNLGHAVKQWFRMGEEPFDIGCLCHHHDPMVETFIGHGEQRWACRPGSYQITSGYSRQYGFNRTGPTCPTFILFPGERRIVGFHDIRDAVIHLSAVRA